jgi:phage shock protein C
MIMERRLYKDEHRKMIGGVCAGLAEYFNIDVTLIRILFFATLILKGGGLVIYVILWVCLPKKGYLYNPTVDYKVPPNPFGSTPAPQPNAFTNMPPKRASKSGTVIGAILIVIGAFFLLDEFNIIPDWDFDLENIWPVILVGIGLLLIFSGAKRRPWDNDNWHHTANDTDKKEEALNDNPPIA